MYNKFLLCFLLATCVLPITSQAAGASESFNLSSLQAIAKELAAKPFDTNRDKITFTRKLSYEEYHNLLFRSENAYWKKENLPFTLEFFPLGWLYERKVTICEVVEGKAREIEYNKSFFTGVYDKKNNEVEIPRGFAGFRIHGQLGSTPKTNEFFVFLGASYFRALAQGLGYGLSTRGLALNTVNPKGEEFPSFTQFWVVRPSPDSLSITVYALLESESCTGGYQFNITTGAETRAVVHATIFMRKAVERVGIAPLTSMYWYGENSYPKPNDYRPEVHDSDGLLIADHNGEWIWRPLTVGTKIRDCSFQTNSLLGFGLMLRDRDFANYQDIGARHETRPSIWVEPLNDFGAGSVQLVEIPTDTEYMDNIVAFWVPNKPVSAGDQIDVSYRLIWFRDDDKLPPLGRVIATRRTSSNLKSDGERTSTLSSANYHDQQEFVIDFAPIKGVPLDDAKRPEIIFEHSPGVSVINKFVVVNPETKGWRVFLILKFLEEKKPVELNLKLTYNGQVVTEKWNYLWQP
jgi:glucans biosynthesis protein